MALLCESQNSSSTLAHLCDASWRRIHQLGIDSLDGIYNYDVRFHLLDMLEYLLQICLTKNQTVFIIN